MEIAFITRFTYASFHKQLRILFDALNKIGVKWYLYDPDLTLHMAKKEVDAVVMWESLNYLKHKKFLSYDNIPFKAPKSYLFYVSDTDRIGIKLAQLILENEFDSIITPSTWSAKGFNYYGIDTKVVPHAFALEKRSNESGKENRGNTVMAFAFHSPLRKGLAFTYSAIYENKDKIERFYNLTRFPMHIPQEVKYDGISDEELSKVYSKTHYLLHPVFGGAFEISILECLALGCTPIVPSKGAWMDFVRPEDAILIESSVDARNWHQIDDLHFGLMVHPSYPDLVEKLHKALEKPFYNNHASYYQETFSPVSIAQKFVKVLEKS
jgi:hypothetical protein